MPEINGDIRSGGSAASHQLAPALEGLDALVPSGGPNVLDHNVDAFFIRDLPDLLGNLLFVMIDAVVRAQLAALGQFRLVARSRNHAAVEEFANLNRRDADSGTRSKNQYSLPRTNAGPSDQHVPCGQEHERNARRLIEFERVGN